MRFSTYLLCIVLIASTAATNNSAYTAAIALLVLLSGFDAVATAIKEAK